MHRKPTKIHVLLLHLLQGLTSASSPCSVPAQEVHCSSADFDSLQLRTEPLPHITCGKAMYYIPHLRGILITIYILGFKLFPFVRQKYIYLKLIQNVMKNIKDMVFLTGS